MENETLDKIVELTKESSRQIQEILEMLKDIQAQLDVMSEEIIKQKIEKLKK
ncbi:MAG: hypothetical protein AABY22_07615 [Nanoarchaeota archaeon]